MKKIIYLTAFALLFAACGKDDVTINTNPQSIVGNWKSTYYYVDDIGDKLDIPNYDKYTYGELTKPLYLTFSADTACGMTWWEDASKKHTYSYYINKDRIIWDFPACNEVDNFIWFFDRWSIVNNKLIITLMHERYAYLVFVRL